MRLGEALSRTRSEVVKEPPLPAGGRWTIRREPNREFTPGNIERPFRRQAAYLLQAESDPAKTRVDLTLPRSVRDTAAIL